MLTFTGTQNANPGSFALQFSGQHIPNGVANNIAYPSPTQIQNDLNFPNSFAATMQMLGGRAGRGQRLGNAGPAHAPLSSATKQYQIESRINSAMLACRC